MRSLAVALLLMFPACGRVQYDLVVDGGRDGGGGGDGGEGGDSGGGGDSGRGGDDGGIGDGGGPTSCSWTGSFTLSAPVRVTELSSNGNEQEPWLTNDGLTVWFVSNRDGGFGQNDLWTATRASRGAPFSAPINAGASINTTANEGRGALSPSGLTLYVTSGRSAGIGRSDIWAGTRASTSASFSGLLPIPDLDTPGDEYDLVPSPDGRHVYFIRAPLGGATGTDLYSAEVGLLATAFTNVRVISELSSTAIDANPSVSADERVLVFSSVRGGDNDLYFATRASAASAWSAPAPVPSINTSGEESESFLTPDGCELWFAANRPGGAGAADLYVSRYVP